jgi:hypothetical protein
MDGGMGDVHGPANRPAGMLPPGPAKVPQDFHVGCSTQGLIQKPTRSPAAALVSHRTIWYRMFPNGSSQKLRAPPREVFTSQPQGCG